MQSVCDLLSLQQTKQQCLITSGLDLSCLLVACTGGLGRAECGQKAALTVCAGPEALEPKACQGLAAGQQCGATRVDS